jgi:hypothetical protein
VGFFSGLGKHMKAQRGGESVGFLGGLRVRGVDSSYRMQAEADATRIRLSEHVYEGVSRVPPADGEEEPTEVGPATFAMPDEKPHPRAQWDDLKGCWILWDDATASWQTIGERGE